VVAPAISHPRNHHHLAAFSRSAAARFLLDARAWSRARRADLWSRAPQRLAPVGRRRDRDAARGKTKFYFASSSVCR
jgi:hypothetical protein